MPGEAEEAVPPSVLTLGVNRNMKSLLGGQETGNNQNTVSCPRLGAGPPVTDPALPPGAFPATRLAGPGTHRGPRPRAQSGDTRGGWQGRTLVGHLRARALSRGWTPAALGPPGMQVDIGKALEGVRGQELPPSVPSLLLGRALAWGLAHPEDRAVGGTRGPWAVGDSRAGATQGFPLLSRGTSGHNTDWSSSPGCSATASQSPRCPQGPLSKGETEAP